MADNSKLAKLDQFTEALNIIRILMEKDEEDKETIHLSVYADQQQQSSLAKIKNVVSLKPDCVSCTGSNIAVLNAFKVACLNYMPSSIPYRFRLFSRKQMLELLFGLINDD